MKTNDQPRCPNEKRYPAERTPLFTALATLTKLNFALNSLWLRQGLAAVTSPCTSALDPEFTGRQPLGFAFTEGQQATFNIPSRHRFVIEHLNISCWAENPHVLVQLVTKSPHMFRSLTLCSSGEDLSATDQQLGLSASIQIQGLTVNAFLFSNRSMHNSSTVPPSTYLQVWGYLEPSSFPDSF